MTFDEYDDFIEEMGKSEKKTYYPSVEDMDQFDPNNRESVLFAVYLYEFGEKPKTNAEKYSRKNLQDFIYKNLELIDSEEN